MTGKAWGAGDLGIDHAQVIANAIREQDYDLAVDMEGFLAEHAAGLTVEQLKTVAAELLAAAAPETADGEAAKKRAAPTTLPPRHRHPTTRVSGRADVTRVREERGCARSAPHGMTNPAKPALNAITTVTSGSLRSPEAASGSPARRCIAQVLSAWTARSNVAWPAPSAVFRLRW